MSRGGKPVLLCLPSRTGDTDDDDDDDERQLDSWPICGGRGYAGVGVRPFSLFGYNDKEFW